MPLLKSDYFTINRGGTPTQASSGTYHVATLEELAELVKSFDYENRLLSTLPAAPETLDPRPNIYIDDSSCPSVVMFWDPCENSGAGGYIPLCDKPPFAAGDTIVDVDAAQYNSSSLIGGFNFSQLHDPNPDTNVTVMDTSGVDTTSTHEIMQINPTFLYGNFSSGSITSTSWAFFDFQLPTSNSNVTSLHTAVCGGYVSGQLDDSWNALWGSSKKFDQVIFRHEHNPAPTLTLSEAQLLASSKSGEWLLLNVMFSQWTAGQPPMQITGGATDTGPIALVDGTGTTITYRVIEFPSGFLLYLHDAIPHTLI